MTTTVFFQSSFMVVSDPGNSFPVDITRVSSPIDDYWQQCGVWSPDPTILYDSDDVGDGSQHYSCFLPLWHLVDTVRHAATCVKVQL